jgi:starvation-inducible outer membrane lipoprotein
MKKKSLLEMTVFLLAGLAFACVQVPAALATENTAPQQMIF